MPPEINPRRRSSPVFLQVVAAVLAGAGAMNAIQAYNAGAPGVPPPVKVSQPKAPESPPAPAPVLTMPKGAKTPNLEPAPSSMMVKAEPGGAPEGVLRHYDDDPEGKTRFDEIQLYSRDSVKKVASKKTKEIKLERRSFDSRFARVSSQGISDGFSRVQFNAMAPAKEEVVVEKPRPAPKPKVVDAKHGVQLIEKREIPNEELFVPSLLHPEDVAERVFWTEERIVRVGASALVAVLGLLYILTTALRPRPKEAA